MHVGNNDQGITRMQPINDMTSVLRLLTSLLREHVFFHHETMNGIIYRYKNLSFQTKWLLIFSASILV